MRTVVSLARSPPPPISALLLAIPPFWLRANLPLVFIRGRFPLVFIRGPFVAEVGSKPKSMGNVVGLRQGNILATAFHPELTDDTRIHELFLSL